MVSTSPLQREQIGLLVILLLNSSIIVGILPQNVTHAHIESLGGNLSLHIVFLKDLTLVVLEEIALLVFRKEKYR